ncbi:MAG: hypothetical protein WEA99_00975 [Brumimicrobium sp.]
MKFITICFTIHLMIISCSSSKDLADPQKGEEKTVFSESEDEIQTITSPVVEKYFYNKIGEKTDHTAFYLQRSTQDYFIKLCKSKVTREELENALNNVDGEIKSLTMRVAFRNGEWDRCDENHVQSRTGEYVVIYSIE